MKLVKQYIRAHVLFFATIEMLVLGFSKKSLEILRLAIDNKVLKRLRKQYNEFIQQYLFDEDKGKSAERKQTNYVWVCWFQGMKNAPELVQKCYNSLQKNLPESELILITDDNYKEYVQFPSDIQNKIDSGIITKTHLSDLLRLELLIRHGGTWIDATVYLSGRQIPKYMLSSELFLFQALKPGLDGQATRISSWFMTSCTNHPILLLTRAMIYDYWKKHNNMVDYFLLHDFMELAIEAYSDEWSKVIPFSNSVSHILLLSLFNPYDEERYNAICEQTSIHKLSYKFSDEEMNKKGTYFQKIMGE